MSSCYLSFHTHTFTHMCTYTHSCTYTQSYAHAHTLPPPALASLPPVTLGFVNSSYNVSEESGTFRICVEVKEGPLGDQITITINNIDIEAKGKSNMQNIAKLTDTNSRS